MRNLKKLIAAVLAMCVLVTFSLPAFAVDNVNTDAQYLEKLNIINGDGNGVNAEYLAKGTTRIQAAVISLKLYGLLDEALKFSSEENFVDADSLAWKEGRNVLAYLKANPQLGWNGIGGDKFDPNGPATAQMIYKIVLEVLGYKAGKDYIYADTIKFAAEKGLTKISTVKGQISNANLVTALIEALNTPVAGGTKTLAEVLGYDMANIGEQEIQRVKVDANGLDASGRVVAYYGAPDDIDGEIEDAWNVAEPVKFTKISGSTDTTATLRVLWDDYAVYFLAEVKDANISDASGNVYEKDSVEFFLDEDNKRCGIYEGDDSQFRINFKNERSADHGDLTNLYSAAKVVADGYVIEGRVALSETPANGKVMGMEGQINDATGSTRIATINIFDTTGTAYQDTSKFGQLILTGKGPNSISKPNYYDLKSLVISAKDIELQRYSNGDVVDSLIKESEAAIADKASTQAQFDQLLIKLQAAIDNLVHNDLSFDEKECRDIPKAYRTSDPENIRGTIVRVDYKTNTYDQEAKDLDKYMLVYLPHGYDANDKTKKYDILYLIHGNAESQHTAFGDVNQNTELMRVVDNLIADGKMKPTIIVTPTWYNTAPFSPERQNEDGMFRIKNFHNELVKDIIPTIEGKFNVYAESTSEKDLIAARNHRAVGGFSMGSACTWFNYIYSIDYFKYYIPISLWCFQDIDSIKKEGYNFTGTDDEIRAKYLAEIAKKAGYTKDDIRIFCATGTADLAYSGMNAQVDEMKKLTDIFVYSADLRKGNFYYLTLNGGAHNWTCVNRYLYNILPDLFLDSK
ncbi:esterase [Ruminiclostridium herbifermentans]|uniref:Esterase n=1 Tax=Ruminiclostridium herbifermentans TaxID=2488810 RepID=A0A4V6ENM3_9FIRM|nr:sugar-binding protein [Ruminiclostridium herbifermentans]QNU65773.1 esterase [Ruminiclostridium herbifermentans]